MAGVHPIVYVANVILFETLERLVDLIISGQRCRLIVETKRELKRRSAIVVTIGHMKTDGRLGWNFLNGIDGDAISALSAAAGHNRHLNLNALVLFGMVSLVH